MEGIECRGVSSVEGRALRYTDAAPLEGGSMMRRATAVCVALSVAGAAWAGGASARAAAPTKSWRRVGTMPRCTTKARSVGQQLIAVGQGLQGVAGLGDAGIGSLLSVDHGDALDDVQTRLDGALSGLEQ